MKYLKYLQEVLAERYDEIVEECEKNGDVIEVRIYNSETEKCWHFKVGDVNSYITMLASQFNDDWNDVKSTLSAIQMIKEQNNGK